MHAIFVFGSPFFTENQPSSVANIQWTQKVDFINHNLKGKDREKLTLIRSVDVSGDEVADNSIDLWLGSHVIEHFADPNHFLSSAYRKLRPEGILFQEFPLQAGGIITYHHYRKMSF